MDQTVKNKIKEHIGGHSDNYAKIIEERLLKAGHVNSNDNPYKAYDVRRVFGLKRNHAIIEAELLKLYKERDKAFKKQLKQVGIKTKKTEAVTSVSN